MRRTMTSMETVSILFTRAKSKNGCARVDTKMRRKKELKISTGLSTIALHSDASLVNTSTSNKQLTAVKRNEQWNRFLVFLYFTTRRLGSSFFFYLSSEHEEQELGTNGGPNEINFDDILMNEWLAPHCNKKFFLRCVCYTLPVVFLILVQLYMLVSRAGKVGRARAANSYVGWRAQS